MAYMLAIHIQYILKIKMEQLFKNGPALVPGMKWYPMSSFWFACPTEELSENGLRYVKLALQLHEAFNFAQMLQGEILDQQVTETGNSDGIWTKCRHEF